MSRKSVYDHLDRLMEFDIAQKVDTGSSARYRTGDSEIAEKLYELNGGALQRLLDLEGAE